MKNKLVDLNNILFEQLERLNDEDIKNEELQEEICRSKAISNVANQIISNGRLAIRAAELRLEYQEDSQKCLPSFME